MRFAGRTTTNAIGAAVTWHDGAQWLCEARSTMPANPEGQEGPTTPSEPATAAPMLGDVVHVDDRTILVMGQELDVEGGRPDVANCLLHLTGDTLVVVDTGATVAFREAIRRAAEGLGAWTQLLLLTTHGHTDHVGNNDLVDELAAARGASVQHFIPAADVPQMLNPVEYWTWAFRRIEGLAPMPAPPHLSAAFIVSLFEPLHPFGATTRTYEELPMVAVELGTWRLNGWSFADGAVIVMRSQGHTAGHVLVYLRDSRLLHLGDEDNGACASMPDSDQVKVEAAFSLAGALLQTDVIDAVTDGHNDQVRRGDEARSFLTKLLDDATAITEFSRSVSGESPVDDRQFVEHVSDYLSTIDASSANPNPVFTAMMSVNLLTAEGLEPPGHGHSWRRVGLDEPQPVSGRPKGLALIPAAIEVTTWKLRTRGR